MCGSQSVVASRLPSFPPASAQADAAHSETANTLLFRKPLPYLSCQNVCWIEAASLKMCAAWIEVANLVWEDLPSCFLSLALESAASWSHLLKAMFTFMLQFLHTSGIALAPHLPVMPAEASFSALGAPSSQFWLFHKPKLCFSCPGLMS